MNNRIDKKEGILVHYNGILVLAIQFYRDPLFVSLHDIYDPPPLQEDQDTTGVMSSRLYSTHFCLLLQYIIRGLQDSLRTDPADYNSRDDAAKLNTMIISSLHRMAGKTRQGNP
jgi:hypothetical protein